MPRANVLRATWTGGRVSPLAVGRVDLERMASTSEAITNVMTRVMGSISIRPGFRYVRSLIPEQSYFMEPFARSPADTAVLVFRNLAMEVEIGGAPLTRQAVECSVTNGTFASETGWTVDDTEGSVVDFGADGLELSLPARGSKAKVRQQVTTGSSGLEHGLRVVVGRGEVAIRIGTALGTDSLFRETVLRQGSHSLAITPTAGSFWVEFIARRDVVSIVTSCEIEPAGLVVLPAPWPEASLPLIRTCRSLDVVFVACRGVPQHRIERFTTRSWSVVRYATKDGPFTIGTTANVKLKPDVLTGNGTLEADRPFFSPSHVGALFRIYHSGQRVETLIAGDDEYSDAIRITGVDENRNYEDDVTGDDDGIVNQRSVDSEDTGFVTGDQMNTSEDRDAYANSIAWRRYGFPPGTYTGGVAHVSLAFGGGGGYGICRVVKHIDSMNVEIEVLRRFQQVTFSGDWREGEWSGVRTYPTAVAIVDGRLVWAGDDRVWFSVSDAYDSFDEDVDGDSGPIVRSIGGEGGGDVNWILPLQRPIVGSDFAEASARSSSFDEPLTPAGNTIKDASTQGAAPLAAVKVDKSGFFVQRSGTRVYRVQFSVDAQDYSSDDVCELVPEIGEPSIIKLGVQRQPDTRLYALRSDGTFGVLTYYVQGQSSVLCWTDIETNGEVKDFVILPAPDQDEVHVIVERTIAGEPRLFREVLEAERADWTGDFNRLADSHVWSESGSLRTVVTGGSHLAGANVVVWADGKRQPNRTVAADGTITLATPARNVLFGLGYGWRTKSTKLAYAAAAGTALGQPKRIEHLALLLHKTHVDGVKFGPDFDHLEPLARVHEGAPLDADHIFDELDAISQEFNGTWSTDSRVCLAGEAPYPATVLAMVMSMQTSDRL